MTAPCVTTRSAGSPAAALPCALTAALFAAALLGELPSAAATETRVVAVLYFDNNTGDRELDVLKKGFADMMITDLAEVDGITVVERDKLQALIDEIKLQKSPYFDKKTAIRLGKGLGAHYAVTGTINAAKPKLRIDVRMIEIATGRVMLASKVTGPESEIFDLEQSLVEKFVAGLKKRHVPSFQPRTRVPDLDTLIEYSRGIDLADRGLYRDAEKAMAQIIRRAPAFALARIKRDVFLKRLKMAKERRDDIRAERGVRLAKLAETYLERHRIGQLDQEGAKIYLGYRVLRGRFIVRAMAKHLSKKGYRLIKTGHTVRARRLMKAYYANFELLIKEHRAYAKTFTQTYADGRSNLDTDFELPDAEQRRAREAGIDDSFGKEGRNPEYRLAEYLLLGAVWDPAGKKYTVGPTLSDLEPRFAKIGYQILKKHWRRAHGQIARDPYMEGRAIDILETHAEALFLRGKREQALGKLQEILDRYPTSSNFKQVERRIKQELGLEHNHNIATRARYFKSLKTCEDMDLRVGWGGIIGYRSRTMGMKAAPYTVAEMEKHCKTAPKLGILWPYIYTSAALFGARHDDCDMFNKYIAMSIEHGGSTSDAAGYRKNYSNCPAP
ncbi:MAG: CsgG/HfaB family protein [Proteobacteria bacterium]|nr:CsgG/HfaB family protein [Pseudomonadota bacterium]